jgi:hypothetical protein
MRLNPFRLARGGVAQLTDRDQDAGDDGDWQPGGDEGADSAELHYCSWCGALLLGDLEDEIDGDGSGHDMCGNCNRTKNWEAIEMER